MSHELSRDVESNDTITLIVTFYREYTGDATLSEVWCLGHHIRSQWWRLSWRERLQFVGPFLFTGSLHFRVWVWRRKNSRYREFARGFFNRVPWKEDSTTA